MDEKYRNDKPLPSWDSSLRTPVTIALATAIAMPHLYEQITIYVNPLDLHIHQEDPSGPQTFDMRVVVSTSSSAAFNIIPPRIAR